MNAERVARIGGLLREMKPLAVGIQTVGNVGYDETRLTSISPKIEGWIERLYVNFTGASVRRGQPLMEVYAPMLVAAQEELILARRLVAENPELWKREGITKALLTNAACNGSPAITYGGGGSTVGEDAMRNNLQNISPMSRALNNNTNVQW